MGSVFTATNDQVNTYLAKLPARANVRLVTPMKNLLLRFILPLIPAAGFAAGVDFHEHLGIQMWSLRDIAKTDEIKALDQAKAYGFVEIEAGKPAKVPLDQYVAAVKQRGFDVVGIHAGYEALGGDLADVIATAKALGAHYIVCPWIPHPKEGLSVAQAHKVAADFDTWGKAIHAAGLQFGWHPHGFEFVKAADGGQSPFEIVVSETQSENLVLEMDVFWVFHAGQDPVALLEKYGDRWQLMHVKDIRKGAVTHLSTGSAPPTDNVPVGSGQIDWLAVLSTAEKVGVKHFFIEDETPAPLQCIPASLKYLHGLKL